MGILSIVKDNDETNEDSLVINTYSNDKISNINNNLNSYDNNTTSKPSPSNNLFNLDPSIQYQNSNEEIINLQNGFDSSNFFETKVYKDDDYINSTDFNGEMTINENSVDIQDNYIDSSQILGQERQIEESSNNVITNDNMKVAASNEMPDNGEQSEPEKLADDSHNQLQENNLINPITVELQAEKANVQINAPETIGESQVKLDPMNNSINEIPVNPVAPIEEDYSTYKTNIIKILLLYVGVLFAPGKVLDNNIKKYNKIMRVLFVTITLSILGLIGSVLSTITLEMLSTGNGEVVTEIGWNLSALFENGLKSSITISLLSSLIAIIVCSSIYFITSFFSSKGISFTNHLFITTLSFVPFVITFNVIMPMISLVSYYVGFFIVFMSFFYTLMILTIYTNSQLTFKSTDKKIYYNVCNLIIIFSIIFVIALYLTSEMAI